MPLFATTCTKGSLKYKNLYKDNLSVVLYGEKNKCLEEIGLSTSSNLNDINYVRINNKLKLFKSIIIFDKLDSSYWKLNSNIIDDDGLIFLEKKYNKRYMDTVFNFCTITKH